MSYNIQLQVSLEKVPSKTKDGVFRAKDYWFLWSLHDAKEKIIANYPLIDPYIISSITFRWINQDSILIVGNNLPPYKNIYDHIKTKKKTDPGVKTQN
jgi:hypothetical protein